MILPFHPTTKSTVLIDVSAVSQKVQVFPERGPISVRVFNSGSDTVWITFGDSNVSSNTTTCIPIPANMVEVYTLDNVGDGPLYVAAIAAGSTGKIYFSPGKGI